MTNYTKTMMESLAEVRGLQEETALDEQWEKKLKKVRGNTAGAEGQRAAIEDDIAREKEKKNPDKKLIESELDEGKMSELHQHIKDGKSASEIAKIMKVDEKTIKTLMSGFKESARSDAMKAMRGDPLLGKRDEKEVDDDIATAADVKAASKNIMFQLQNLLSLKGSAGELKLTPAKKKEIAAVGSQYAKRVGSGYVEFANGKKEKVDPKIAIAVWRKFNSIRRPIDKQVFQAKVAKSYKDMLKVLKESVMQESILERVNRQINEIKELREARPLGRWELANKKFELVYDKGTYVLVSQGTGDEKKLKAKTPQDATQELVKKGYRES